MLHDGHRPVIVTCTVSITSLQWWIDTSRIHICSHLVVCDDWKIVIVMTKTIWKLVYCSGVVWVYKYFINFLNEVPAFSCHPFGTLKKKNSSRQTFSFLLIAIKSWFWPTALNDVMSWWNCCRLNFDKHWCYLLHLHPWKHLVQSHQLFWLGHGVYIK